MPSSLSFLSTVLVLCAWLPVVTGASAKSLRRQLGHSHYGRQADSSLTESNWTQVGENFYTAGADANFGASVSLNSDGTVIAVGGDAAEGVVKVYERNSSSNLWLDKGNRIQGVVGTTDALGKSVSLSAEGEDLTIGSPGHESNKGKVLYYRFENDDWVLRKDWTGIAPSDNCGQSVAMAKYGNYGMDDIVVAFGCPATVGQVSIHHYSSATDTWSPRGNALRGSICGNSVALSANGLVVAFECGQQATGGQVAEVRIYGYDRATDGWVKMGDSILGSEATGYHQDNSFVSLSGDGRVVAVGESGYKSGMGRARIFEYNSKSWEQRGGDISFGYAGFLTGSSVSLSEDGNTVAVGSPTELGGGQVNIYVFDGASWVEQRGTIAAQSRDKKSGNAVSLSSDGMHVAVGANKASSGRGRAGVYSINANSATESTTPPTTASPNNPSPTPSPTDGNDTDGGGGGGGLPCPGFLETTVSSVSRAFNTWFYSAP